MTRVLKIADREKTAERLLNSSADKFYDPEVDIDWAAPLVDGLRYTPEHRCSLYGTPLWDRMSPEQRIELSKHEVASIASVGLWFELLLGSDLLTPIGHARVIADELRRAELVIYPGAGHMLPLERAADVATRVSARIVGG